MDNTTTSPNPIRVLVIEDEQFISDLYVRALEKAGYEVQVIVDGNQALAEAQTDAYDIILLDIMIPNLTGTEILRRLRDPAQTPKLHAKIIVTTNLELAGQGKEEIDSLVDGYIIKAEVTPKELATFLSELNLSST